MVLMEYSEPDRESTKNNPLQDSFSPEMPPVAQEDQVAVLSGKS
jgi:hypothetical protein